LVFFSTASGDAWMLDPQDGLALKLAEAGKRNSAKIVETANRFTIEWTASYRLDGDAFVMMDGAGQRAIFGYPVREVALAQRRIRRYARTEVPARQPFLGGSLGSVWCCVDCATEAGQGATKRGWRSRARRLFPRPSLRRSEPNDVAEVVQALESLLGRALGVDPTQPVGTILGAQHHVVVAHDLRPMIREKGRQPRLELILMGDQKVATQAVTAGFVQSHQLKRVYVDDQRQLALARLTSALWAGREADVRVRIQEKALARQLLTQTPARLAGARPPCHQRITSTGSIPSSASQASTRWRTRAALNANQRTRSAG
jgi:hypothetical protein